MLYQNAENALAKSALAWLLNNLVWEKMPLASNSLFTYFDCKSNGQ